MKKIKLINYDVIFLYFYFPLITGIFLISIILILTNKFSSYLFMYEMISITILLVMYLIINKLILKHNLLALDYKFTLTRILHKVKKLEKEVEEATKNENNINNRNRNSR